MKPSSNPNPQAEQSGFDAEFDILFKAALKGAARYGTQTIKNNASAIAKPSVAVTSNMVTSSATATGSPVVIASAASSITVSKEPAEQAVKSSIIIAADQANKIANQTIDRLERDYGAEPLSKGSFRLR